MSTRSASKGKATGKVAAVDLTLSSDEDATPSKAVAGRSGKATNGKSAAPTPKKGSTTTSTPAASANKKRKAKVESDSDEYDDEDDEPRKPAKKRPSLGGAAAKGGRGKAKVEESSEEEYKARTKKEETSSEEEEDESEEEESSEEEEKPKKKAPAKKAPAKKAPPKKATASTSKAKAKKGEDDDDVKMEDAPAKKPFKWNGGARAGPSNPGSKEVPEGTPNCFGGLTFVFTGELESLGRDECTSIAKRYGGRVTTSVSSKTSYVVIGSEPGESKLKVIKANKIATLDEDGFLRLIVTRSKQKPDKDYVAKQEEEMKKIKTAAKAITVDPNLSKNALWTVKYAPQNLKDLCGNKGQVEKLQAWLEAWPKNRASNFTKPGKDGLGTLRACLLSGPPGIGKTTSAHLVARLAGFRVIEMNASDTRSKKLLDAMLKSTLDNTVLDGFMTSKPKEGAEFADLSSQSCLIMDEVDGTSGGDRGGIGALVQLIKKTKIPIICIANDKSIPKMKPLLACCNQLPFKRPTVDMIRSRLMTVAFKEGMKIDKTVSDQLVQGTQADIRQIINILSTWKLTSNKMTYDETKALTDLRDPNALATPFTLMDRLFAPQSWGQSSGTGASQKLEVYFQEFDVLPLFVQENYLKHKYTRANAAGTQGSREHQRKVMELTSKAADAISDGDLVDRMIHGTQQHWTLMPVHGMMSTVTPSFHCYGMGGYGGGFGANADASKNTRMFPSWFGKNSTQGRLQRLLTDIQIRMRLKVSGDRREIRQSYIPVLFNRLLDPLVLQEAEGIPEIIELMDEYYLTKEEWDGLMELGIGENTAKPLLDKIKTATKSAFTRKYNSSDHPIPFHKGTDLGPMKKMAKAEKPDFEEAFEDDVGANDEEEEKKPTKKELEGGIQDKLVKEKKAKGAAKKAAAAPKNAPAKKK